MVDGVGGKFKRGVNARTQSANGITCSGEGGEFQKRGGASDPLVILPAGTT